MRLEGFGPLVREMETMVRFYRDGMGFEIAEGEDTDNVCLRRDGVLFLPYGRRDFEWMTGRPFAYAEGISGHFEIVLQAESPEAVARHHQALTEKGAASVMSPAMVPWGQRTCYVADPEGNLIKIGTLLKEADHGI